jgi:hypothetical protein
MHHFGRAALFEVERMLWWLRLSDWAGSCLLAQWSDGCGWKVRRRTITFCSCPA